MPTLPQVLRARSLRHAAASLATTTSLLIGGAVSVGAQSTPLHSPPRKFVDRSWVALWHTSGDPDDALFGLPREIVATEEGLIVLDVGTRQLSSFGRDARKHWTVGKHGRGPGEFVRPVDVTLMPGGDIGVLDPGSGRITVYSQTGQFRATFLSGSAAIASSVCSTTDGRLHFIASGAKAFVVTGDTAGKQLRTHRFPWTIPTNSPSMLTSASFARGVPGDDCTLASTFGFGIASLRTDGPLRASPFIETIRPPAIKQQRIGKITQQTLTSGENAARAAFHWRDTLFVNFAGASRNPHLLDLYHADGRYMESWTPPAGTWFAYANGILYSIVNSSESPEIVAFAAASDTARILRELRATRPAAPSTKKRQLGS